MDFLEKGKIWGGDSLGGRRIKDNLFAVKELFYVT